MTGEQYYSGASRQVWSLRQSGGTNISGFTAGTPPTLTATGNSTKSGAFAQKQGSPSAPTFPGGSAWGAPGPVPAGLGPGGLSPTSYDGGPSTPIDLLNVTDVSVWVTATLGSGGAPSLLVQLDLFDQYGNVFLQVAKMSAALTATGKSSFSAGLHSSGLVLPRWGQITWTLDGASSWSAVDVEVVGR